MVFFRYDANILPTITLIGQDIRTGMHQNIRRVSEDYIFYLVTEGEMFFNEGGIDYHLHKGDCFLFEPDILHFGTQDSRYQIRYIHFHHPRSSALKRTKTPRRTYHRRDSLPCRSGYALRTLQDQNGCLQRSETPSREVIPVSKTGRSIVHAWYNKRFCNYAVCLCYRIKSSAASASNVCILLFRTCTITTPAN